MVLLCHSHPLLLKVGLTWKHNLTYVPDEEECKFTCDYSVEQHLIRHLSVIWIKLVTWIVLYFVDKKIGLYYIFHRRYFLKNIFHFILEYQLVCDLTLRTQATLSKSLFQELSTRHAKYTHFRSFLTQTHQTNATILIILV